MKKFFVALGIIVVLSVAVMVATDVSIPPSVSGSYISIASSDSFKPGRIENDNGRYIIDFSDQHDLYMIYEYGDLAKVDRIVSVKRLETGNNNLDEWAYQLKARPTKGKYGSVTHHEDRVITISYGYKKQFGKKVYTIEYLNPDSGNRFVYICNKVI